jgi:hypothetical protein
VRSTTSGNSQGISYSRASPVTAAKEKSLGSGDGLPKPQQVNQQLDQVPGAIVADVGDAVGISQHLEQRAELLGGVPVGWAVAGVAVVLVVGIRVVAPAEVGLVAALHRVILGVDGAHPFLKRAL